MTQFCEYKTSIRNIWYHRSWVDDRLYKATHAIEKDPLWKGRFIVRRVHSRLEAFHDGSGYLLHVLIRFYDKKTKIRQERWVDALEIENWLGSWMNEFIVERVRVWENEKPYEECKSWLTHK